MLASAEDGLATASMIACDQNSCSTSNGAHKTTQGFPHITITAFLLLFLRTLKKQREPDARNIIMTVTNTITIIHITIAIAATESCLCQIMVVSLVLVKCWSGFLSKCSPCQVLVWFAVTVQTCSLVNVSFFSPCQMLAWLPVTLQNCSLINVNRMLSLSW